MSTEKTYEEVWEELKLLAKDCKVPIVTATQKCSDNSKCPRQSQRVSIHDGVFIVDYVDLITPPDNSK